ncbi:ribosomal-protein-alanine N-acetyltransferase [Fictibacillus solisalsi]|uniref:Ribosomal-protein-alanine N-acetyltransferase n=1 Tax=Fictibacillus solisalsi TaxID=459525 RepID=A0A1H0B130_9BACL|nr:GNAT family protein [Fictibacillus solisalsi]SDN39344.1 ribosomal-protein-alanine N-acetyltransferase [Fictibacillus solisalsi]
METVSIIPSFPELFTQRYHLRKIEESDALDLHEVYSDSEVVKYWGVAPFESIEQTASLIRDFQNGFSTGATIRWGIAEITSGRVIGTCGFHNWAKKKWRAEVGYEIRRSEWRKGVMSEVLSVILPYGFQRMELNRIGALIHPDNFRSAKLAVKLGFQAEGQLRDYQFVEGEFQDLVMFSLLKKDTKW